jgi:hypothetical protein
MRTLSKLVLATLLVGLISVFATGCKKETVGDKIGKNIDKAVKKTDDAADKAAKETKKATE